jgi:hypothetical protein
MIRAFISGLRSLPRGAALTSSGVARHAMHQQYFGAPGVSNRTSKSGHLARVTGLKVSLSVR